MKTKINKTKKIISLIAVILLLLTLVTGAVAEVYPAQKTAIVLVTRSEPFPAQPGDYVEVWLKVISFTSAKMEDVVFTLTPKYPFYLDASETADRALGDLESGEQATLKYKVRVDESAVEMDVLLDYEYSTRATSPITGSVSISVKTSDADLDVESITVENEFIEHNKPTKVVIELKNNADSMLKDITVKLDLTSTTIPIVPIGSTNEKKLYSIKGKETADIEFSLAALSNADSGIYKIPLQLKYSDELGNQYIKDTIIGLAIGSEPNLNVMIETSNIVKKGMVGTVDLKIVNKGLIDVKFLDIKLKETQDFDIVGVKEEYVGEVDSDDFENVEFRIIIKNGNNNIDLPLSLRYKDANNREYIEEVNVELDLDNIKLGNEKNGGIGNLIIALIVIGGGYFFYRRWKKKRAKKVKR